MFRHYFIYQYRNITVGFMVTSGSIISAIFSAVFLVIYWAAILVGWLIAIPIAILLITWLTDFVKGTQYTSKFFALLLDYFPKPKAKEEEVCPVCGQEDEEHTEEGHNYCYSCGRSLVH